MEEYKAPYERLKEWR